MSYNPLSSLNPDTQGAGSRGTSPARSRISRDSPTRPSVVGWWPEELAALINIAAFCSLIGTLLYVRDKPDDHRPIAFLSLTSTLSILITIVTLSSSYILNRCLGQGKWTFLKHRTYRLGQLNILDEASRGPLGALKLLFQRRSWRLKAAMFAAFVTVACVSLGPIAQALISQDTVVDYFTSSKATFSVATDYYGGAKEPLVAQIEGDDPDPATYDVGMQGAIYRGIHNIPSEVPFNCPSICKWEQAYTSLGFAASCKDVTVQAMQDAQYPPIPLTGTPVPRCGSVTNVTTPNGITLGYEGCPTSYYTAINVTAMRPAKISGPKRQQFSPTFSQIGILRLKSPSNETLATDLNSTNAEVYQCTLGFAAFTYSGIIANGTTLSMSEPKVWELKAGKREVPIFGDSNITYTVSDPEGPQQTFRVSTTDYYALALFVSSRAFSGRIITGESAPRTGDDELAPDSFRTLPSGLSLALLRSNISTTFANTALSMTRHLQSSYPNRIRYETGQIGKTVVYTRVHWYWLTVPTGVIFATLLLLALTMYVSQGDELYKLSFTAGLCHQLELVAGTATRLQSVVKGRKELEKWDKEVEVGPI